MLTRCDMRCTAHIQPFTACRGHLERTMNIVSSIKAFFKDEEGASAIEYALVAALIGLAAATAMTDVGTQLNTFFGKIKTKLQ